MLSHRARKIGESGAIPPTEIWHISSNNNGQAGTNNIVNRSSPVQVGTSQINWDHLSGGSGFSVGIKTNGTLWSWGTNTFGQIAQNDAIARSSPTQIGTESQWAMVVGSKDTQHALALRKNGTLWSWGLGTSGQLGHNDILNRSSPTQVGSSADWSYIAAGWTHSFGIKIDGTLWAWGLGTLGQNGNGFATNRSSPTQIGTLTTWAKVAAGDATGFGIQTDGTLWSWGNNLTGRLGINNIISRSSPTQVGTLTDWVAVEGGERPNAALRSNGTLWTWGESNAGDLGHNSTISRSSPTQVGALTDWLHIAVGTFHVMAVKTNGTFWTWGLNATSGALGHNNTINRSSPTQVGSGTSWGKPVTAGYHSFTKKFP